LAQVILVDENDTPIGSMEKMEAHQKGLLHRAFSIFIFNSRGEMLLQKRALHKYHSGGLWSNACCSHPAPGEETGIAAERRLKEELGISISVKKIFDFVYTAAFENHLTENEFDHVFIGKYDGGLNSNHDEVEDHCFKTMEEIKIELTNDPSNYTAWFYIAFPKLEKWLKTNQYP
jgi:isopentenyl-diphosphate delta-isomerase